MDAITCESKDKSKKLQEFFKNENMINYMQCIVVKIDVKFNLGTVKDNDLKRLLKDRKGKKSGGCCTVN